jgi:DHA1 family tetracycline resistance protein-like MFS transporter
MAEKTVMADVIENPEAVEPAAPSHTVPGVGGPGVGGPRKAAVAFIFATALMDITAIGIVIPVLPTLVKQFNHGNTAAAAGYVGLFGLIFAAMQLIFSPIIGALSDRFGRRPVLLISIFGLGFDYLLMGVSPNIGWLFVGRLISGVTAASFSTAQAYIADITPPDKRAASFGLMGSAFGVGFILGPVIAAVMAPLGPRAPFFAAAGLALINGLYGFFILPESLPKDRRAPFQVKNANPFGSLRLYASRPQLMGLAGVLFLFYLAQQVLPSTFVLYTSYRYGWGVSTIGVSLALTGAASIVTQMFVVKPFVARFGERGALATGLCCGALGFFVYGSAAQAWQYWLGVPIFAGTGLIGPGMQGMMTRRVGPTEQGRLQGANSGVLAMAGLIGPILFTQIFALSIRGAKAGGGLPGLAVWLAGGFLTMALAVTLSQSKAEPLSADSNAA